MTEQVLEITQEQAATATATLAERQKNPEWNAKLVSTTDGWDVKREFKALMEASSKDTAKGGDRLDRIIAGTEKVEMGEVTTGGSLSTAETEDQKRKRLAAIAQSQSRLSGSSNYSPAGQALMSGGSGLGF
jgi:hypothetical protein